MTSKVSPHPATGAPAEVASDAGGEANSTEIREKSTPSSNKIVFKHKDSVAINRENFKLPEPSDDQESNDERQAHPCRKIFFCICGEAEDLGEEVHVFQQSDYGKTTRFDVENFQLLSKEDQLTAVNLSWRKRHEDLESFKVGPMANFADPKEQVGKNEKKQSKVRVTSQREMIDDDPPIEPTFHNKRVLSFSDDTGQPLANYLLIPNRDATWKGWFRKRRGYFVLLFFVLVAAGLMAAFILSSENRDKDSPPASDNTWNQNP